MLSSIHAARWSPCSLFLKSVFTYKGFFFFKLSDVRDIDSYQSGY